MFNILPKHITFITSLLLLGASASRGQGFGEGGSYAEKPSSGVMTDANVNLATGHIAPNLPLLTLPGVAGGVTLSLQYQAGGGIQVNTTASEVGLGWALNGGGFIVRDVKGFPDDSQYGWIIDQGGNGYRDKYFQFGPNPYTLPVRTSGDIVKYFKSRSGNQMQTPLGVTPYGSGYENDYLLTWLYPASQVASYGQYSFSNTYVPYGQPNSTRNFQARWSGVFFPDNEPDIYTLALPTGSLQFVFDPSGNPVPIQAQSIKIQALNIGARTYNADGLLREFLVTTSDGIKYYFGDATTTGFKEHISVTSQVLGMSNLGSKEDLSPYINKWHLRQIVYPSGETINYAYTANKNYEISTNNYLRQDWVFTAINGTRAVNCQQCQDLAHAWHARDWHRNYTVRSTVSSTDVKQLASVTSAQGSIQCSYQTAVRKDVGGSTNALSSIRLLNAQGDVIKRLDFIQHYADSGPIVPNAMTYDRYHLMLDRIVDRGSGCDYTNLWQFNYNPGTFCRNTATKDYWGYLNALAYPYDDILVAPYATPVISTISYSLPGRNRDPSLNFTQYMTLRSITSATGAVQSFAYQLNDDNVGIGSATRIRAVGGLRIYRVSKYDGVDHNNDIVDEYSYRKVDDASQSSGIWGDGGMYNKLQLIHDGIDTNNSEWPDIILDASIRSAIPHCYSTSSTNRRADYYYMLRSDASMYEYAADYIDYSCVTVSHGTKGKTRYEFTSWADAMHQDYVDSDTRQVGNNLNTCPNDPLNPTYRGAVLDLPFSLESDGLSLTSSYNGSQVYTPGISADFPRRSSRAAERGLALRITQLNNNNDAVAATINEYDFSNTPERMPTVNAVYVKPSFEAFGFSQFFTYFQLYYYNISSQWCPLQSTTEILYNQNSSGNITKSIATRTLIEYANYFPSKITKYTTTCSSPTACLPNALGQYQVTEFRRPQSPSFTDGTTAGTADQTSTAGLLRNAGMMATVIEQERYTTATLGSATKNHLSASLNTYRSNNGHVVLYETYESPPATSFTPATVTQSGGTWRLNSDGSYQLTSTVTGYNADALPINTIGRNGLPSATIWGYNHTLPIATISNGTAVTGSSGADLTGSAGHTSFEEASNDGDGWSMPNRRSSDAKTGIWSGRYVRNEGTFGLNKWLFIPIANQHGKLVFSCWAKVPANITSAAEFRLVAASSAPQNVYQPLNNSFRVNPGEGWRYFEQLIDLDEQPWTKQADLSLLNYLWFINGEELLLDEVRIHPADAQMQTVTYLPLVGKTSTTGADGRTTYFTYNSDNSPKLVLNHNRDVLSYTQSKVTNQSVADFSVPETSYPLSPINFVAAMQGCDQATGFVWDFGDGTPPIAGNSLSSVSHTYGQSANSAYDVSLIVTYANKVAKATKTIELCNTHVQLYIEDGDPNPNYCYASYDPVRLEAIAENECSLPVSYQWQVQRNGVNSSWDNVPSDPSYRDGTRFTYYAPCGSTLRIRCLVTYDDGSTSLNNQDIVTSAGTAPGCQCPY